MPIDVGPVLPASLSVSIVYYNNERYLGEVIPKILIPLRASGAKCYLIDNASTDRTGILINENVVQGDSFIHVVRSDSNVGFGRAHNLVLDRLVSDYHLVCNPDIVFDSVDPLVSCLEFMEAHPEVGLATVKLLNQDGTTQYANKLDPTVLDLLLRRFVKRENAPKCLRERMDKYEMRDVGYDKVVDVPFINGAFMVLRTEVYRTIGGFDPRFFLYFEDADLSRKIRAVGYRTVFFPGAAVTHLWERAAHKELRMGWILLENMLRFFNKWGWSWR